MTVALANEPGDKIVDQLRGRRVVANDDKDRWHIDAGLLPLFRGLRVMAIQRFERGLQFDRQAQWIESPGFATAFFGHARANVFPEVSELRHFSAGYIVGNWHPRQFHDSTFNGVHEREVAHRPREQGSFGVT